MPRLTRCERCRRGHYAMPSGKLTNVPCLGGDCGCWVCNDRTMAVREKVGLEIARGEHDPDEGTTGWTNQGVDSDE